MVDEPVNQVIKPKPRKPSFNRSGPNLTGSVRIITCATLLALYFAVKQVYEFVAFPTERQPRLRNIHVNTLRTFHGLETYYRFHFC